MVVFDVPVVGSGVGPGHAERVGLVLGYFGVGVGGVSRGELEDRLEAAVFGSTVDSAEHGAHLEILDRFDLGVDIS